jgi:hypothetical protein
MKKSQSMESSAKPLAAPVELVTSGSTSTTEAAGLSAAPTVKKSGADKMDRNEYHRSYMRNYMKAYRARKKAPNV